MSPSETLLHSSWTLDGQLALWGVTHQEGTVQGVEIAKLWSVLRALEIESAAETSLSIPLEAMNELASAPALLLEPYDALFLLSSLPPSEELGLAFGGTLLFWTGAMRFLLELLMRGRYLPSLGRTGNVFHARWLPALNEDRDRSRFHQLSNAMPALACLPRGSEPTAVLNSFLLTGVHELSQRFLARSDLGAQCALSATRNAKNDASLRWLTALTRPSNIVDAALPELVRLEDRLRRWSSAVLEPSERVPLRVTLKLHAPLPSQAADSKWHVEFFVQSRFETRHTVSARDFWRGQIGFLKHTPYTREEVELLLLEGLGQAATKSRAIREALHDASPFQAELTLEEAYRFLRDEAPILEGMGLGVVLPSWWTSSRPTLGLELELREAEGGSTSYRSAVGLQHLFEFSWKLSVGEAQLSADEFQNLVSAQSPLVPVGGSWVELPREKLASTIDFLRRTRERREMTLLEALQLRLGQQDESNILPVVAVRPTGWIKRFLNGEPIQSEPVEQPPEFVGSLRPYQLEGLTWLHFLSTLGIGGCLADDMGLGKTVQLLALLLIERNAFREQDSPAKPTLLVVPMSILGNWERECRRFAPTLKVYLHHGITRLSGESFRSACREADLVITTYALVHRDEHEFMNVEWGRLALDEAQNIKNIATKQTKAVRRLSARQLERGDAKFQRVALTGTPLENHLEELWSILDFLNPGLLGSVAHFRAKFASPIEKYRDKQVSERLAAVVKPFILRRLKSDPRVLSDLPEKMEMDELISLTPQQAAAYQRVLDEMLPQVQERSGIHRKGTILATITRLKQVCDHPALVFGGESVEPNASAKLVRLQELLETVLEEGDKALIFTQYAKVGTLLQSILSKRFDQEVLFLHGGLTRTARDTLIQRFQGENGPRLFVLSLKAGGLGLNLTAANHVIHYDQWWNPAVESQATDRVYRIGQTRNVQVRKLITRGTLEEKVAELLHEKRKLAGEVVPSAGNILTELRFDELEKVFSLANDVFVEENDA